MEALPSGSSISEGGSRESHTSPSGRCFKKKTKRLKVILFMHLFLAELGLHCYMDFSIVAVSRAYSLAAVSGFSMRWLLLLQTTASRGCGLKRLRFPGSRAQAQ